MPGDAKPKDGANEKLIRKKTEWAEERRETKPPSARTIYGDRLPPGQHLAEGWPVLDLGIKPDVPTAKWSLAAGGLVASPRTLDWADFMALPRRKVVSDFHCVTTWSTFDNLWEGVLFRDFCELVRPNAEAKHVVFSSSDAYTTNLPLEACLDDDVLIVHSWNKNPLTRDHGGPVRMIVPKRYAWKSAKWLRAVDFLAEDAPGFWEVRGYSNTAFPFEDDRFGG